jgi:transposase
MARRRIDTHRLRELVRLRRMGVSARRVARLLRLGPNTERRYRDVLTQAGLLAGSPDQLPTLEELSLALRRALPPRTPPQERSSVERWRPRIADLWARGLTAQATYDRLRTETPPGEPPFRGSYPAVKRLVRQLEVLRGVQAEDVVVPVETRAGEAAQVDFGYAGRLLDPASGALRRAWCFVLVLTHSRVMFVRLVFDQSIETWIDLHVRAFAELGGVPTTVRPDNARNAVMRAAFAVDDACDLNRSYRELAQFYRFKVEPTPPGQPWKKGAAEAAVRYLRSGPLKAREGQSIDEVQSALARWNREVAGLRVHGTTGRRPRDVFEAEERGALRPLPVAPYDRVLWKKAKVHPDCHVALRQRLFSVPWTLVQREVWLRATTRSVEIFHDDRCVATHARTDRRRTTDEAHLPPGRRDFRHRCRDVWVERAQRVGPATFALVQDVFDADPVLSHLRQVQAIVTHLERHPRERAEATARLARRVGDYSYQWVKHVLANALDLQEKLQPQVLQPRRALS